MMSVAWSEARPSIEPIQRRRTQTRLDDHPVDVEFTVRSVTYGDFGADLLQCDGVGYWTDVEPADGLRPVVVTEGHGRITVAGQDLPLDPDEGMLDLPQVPYSVYWRKTTVGMLRLPIGYVADLAEERTGLPAADLRFESTAPVSPATHRQWAGTTASVCRRLAGAPERDVDPLTVEQLFRLAASAVLSAFANTAMTAPYLPGGGRVGAASVRRAAAYLDEQAGRPLTVGEIADAAGVGPRALAEAFRHHRDTTPWAYARRVRLDGAHHDLHAADPTGVTTVGGVAHRWGFGNLERFARDYQTAYGRAPADTLTR